MRTAPWEHARADVHARLGPEAWSPAWSLTGGALWGPVNGLVGRVRGAVAATGESERAGAELRLTTLDAVLRQHEAPWLSLFDALGRPGVEGLARVAESAGFAASLAGLDPARIRAEENAELRRVMLEHFGYDRYLAESGATPVHRDETGVLWRVDLPGDEPVAMVEVVNSTAEPDGTFRTYWLRVPPLTRTAREGVAWTFGLGGADYHPTRET